MDLSLSPPDLSSDVVIVAESSEEEDDEGSGSGPGPAIAASSASMALSENLHALASYSLQNQGQGHGGLVDLPAQTQSQSRDRPIRSRIESARLLLQAADLLSRPESPSSSGVQPGANSNLGVNRYAISRNVMPNDFYRERDLASLCDVTSLLQTRLSVERIYNLGPPQSSQEREIFDELLMTRFSDLITGDGERNVDSLPNQHSSVEATGNQQPSSTHSEPSETDLSTAQVAPRLCSSNSGSGNVFDSTQVMNTLQGLRRSIEDNPEIVVGDRELVNVVSDFVQYLKKSPVLSPAIVFSPAKTPSKSRKRQRNAEEDCSSKDTVKEEISDDEEESCTICLEPWTTGGDHRICCLKCGHIFGYSCICKWIKQAHSCPQCKMPAKKDDIRSLFARKLTAEDTSERDRALKLLEEEKAKARSLEHKEALARREVDSQSRLILTLEARVAYFKNENAVSSLGRSEGIGQDISSSRVDNSNDSGGCGDRPAAEGSHRGYKYKMLARVGISQDGCCRVFGHSQEMGMVVVSTKSPNPLFRGFGIKLLARDFRVLSYQPLHSALIRDLSFRPNTFDGTLLSCGMDKLVQLTSVSSKSVIHKFTLSASGWCCSWNTSNNNLFYVGMERGLVKEFDIRRTDGPVHSDVLDLGGAPIASVSYLDEQSIPEGSQPIKGVLIGQIRNLVFREKEGDAFFTHALPNTQAPIMGNSCFTADGHFLTSFRPSGPDGKCKYEVSRLMRRRNNIFCHKVVSWEGASIQPVISRNCLFTNPDSEHQMFAATANQETNKVSIRDVLRRREFQSLNCFDKAYDIKTISTNQQDLLGVLCESELLLYKWSAPQLI